jgi:hypothetical protein
MDPEPKDSPRKHYHIRWVGTPALDWERFTTVAAATARALELVRPGEKFTIEESAGKCSRCGEVSYPMDDDQDSISD